MRCPICKKPVATNPANPYRPFCSERCRMIDLGTWAGGGYTVPGPALEDHEHPDDSEHANLSDISRSGRKKLVH